MNNTKAKDKFVRALEVVAEVIGIVMMILPFFQRNGRRK